MEVVFVSDSFIEQNPCGGAENADQVILDQMRKDGVNVIQYLSTSFDVETIARHLDSKIVISNFTGLSSSSKNLIKTLDYSIVEHDFKMLLGRHPNLYEDLIAPKSHVINVDFYRKAKKVIFQSNKHKEVANMNLPLGNSFVCGNCWSDESLDKMTSLIDSPKEYKAAILNHPYPNKNTKGSIEFCEQKEWKSLVIPRTDHSTYLSLLAKCEVLVFLPTIFETYSRVAAEARCLGLDLITNSNTSFFLEPESKFKGLDLIEALRKNKETLIKLILD